MHCIWIVLSLCCFVDVYSKSSTDEYSDCMNFCRTGCPKDLTAIENSLCVTKRYLCSCLGNWELTRNGVDQEQELEETQNKFDNMGFPDFALMNNEEIEKAYYKQEEDYKIQKSALAIVCVISFISIVLYIADNIST